MTSEELDIDYVILFILEILRDLKFFLAPPMVSMLVSIVFEKVWIYFLTWVFIFMIYYAAEVRNFEQEQNSKLSKLNYLVCSILFMFALFVYVTDKVKLEISIVLFSFDIILLLLIVIAIIHTVIKYLLDTNSWKQIKDEIRKQ